MMSTSAIQKRLYETTSIYMCVPSLVNIQIKTLQNPSISPSDSAPLVVEYVDTIE
jgi:hypothetical protein